MVSKAGRKCDLSDEGIIPVITKDEVNLRRKYEAAIARCVYYQRPAGKLERRIQVRMDQAAKVGKVCEQLSELVDRVPHGLCAHISLNDGIHELMFFGESLGCLIGLYEITDKLPKFIDNIPDYIYNADVAGMSYNYTQSRWSDPTVDIAKRILQYGSSPMLYTPELVSLMPSPFKKLIYPDMNQGKIHMSEVERFLKHDGIWYEMK